MHFNLNRFIDLLRNIAFARGVTIGQFGLGIKPPTFQVVGHCSYQLIQHSTCIHECTRLARSARHKLTCYVHHVFHNTNNVSILFALPVGEEALTMYLAKNKLDRKLANATQNVEALHQLASSYFIDRDGTMRKLHEIQISTNAIKVG